MDGFLFKYHPFFLKQFILQDECDPLQKLKTFSDTKCIERIKISEVDISLLFSDMNGAVLLD